MSDNTQVNNGSGDTIRDIDKGSGIKTQVMVLDNGGGGAESLVSSSNPLSVRDSSSQVDDAAFTPATSRIAMVGAEFDDVSPDSVDEGDGGAIRMSARRELYVQLRDAAGNERGLNINASNQIGVDTELPAAAALADATANPSVPGVGSYSMRWNGSTWDRERSHNDMTQVAQNLSTASTANAITVSGLNAYAGVAVQITGTWTGTLIFEASVDGTNFFTTSVIAIGGTGALATTTTANGQWQGDIAGFSHFRVRCSVTGTGTAVVSIRATLGPAAISIDLPLPAGTNQIGGVNISQINGQTPAMNTGAAGADTLRVVTANNSPVNNAQIGGVNVLVDNGGFTDGTSPVIPAGYIFDETAGTSLTENDVGAARMDNKRALVGVIEDGTTRGQRAGVNSSKGLQVTPIPHTAGGLSLYHLISAATTNANNVKGSAGQLYGWAITNNAASWRYVKIHNNAGTPTAGSGVVMTIGLPPGGGSNISLEMGIAFGTGIAITIVTGIADSDSAAVGASEVNVNLYYK